MDLTAKTEPKSPHALTRMGMCTHMGMPGYSISTPLLRKDALNIYIIYIYTVSPKIDLV